MKGFVGNAHRVCRVTADEHLEDAAPRPFEFRRLGLDLHPIDQQGGTCGDELRQSLHLDKARPASSGWRHPVVVAQRRYVDAGAPQNVQHRAALLLLDSYSVDEDAEHAYTPPTAASGLPVQLMQVVRARFNLAQSRTRVS